VRRGLALRMALQHVWPPRAHELCVYESLYGALSSYLKSLTLCLLKT
jgi:hypothetical protein